MAQFLLHRPRRSRWMTALCLCLGLLFSGLQTANAQGSEISVCDGPSVTVTINRGYNTSGTLLSQSVSCVPSPLVTSCGSLHIGPGSNLEDELTQLCLGQAPNSLSQGSDWTGDVTHNIDDPNCRVTTAVALCVECFIHGKVVEDDPLTDFGLMAVVGETFDGQDEDFAFGFGVSGAVRRTEHVALGAEMTYLASDGDRLDIATTNLDLFGRYYLAPDRDGAAWFLRGGAGWSSISFESRFDSGLFFEEQTVIDSFEVGGFDDSFTLHAGVGVDIARRRGLILRPEVIGRYYEQLEEVQLAVSLSLAFR